MSNLNRGAYSNQAVQVLNVVEYDAFDNPIGLKESQSDPTSCNFGIDRLPRRGGCYKGSTTAYITVTGLLATDTYTVGTSSGSISILAGRINIANGISVFDIKIYRAGVLWAWFKCDENYGTTCYDSSGNGNHGVITNAITVTPEENPNSIHQYQNEFSYHNEVGYSKSGSVFVPKDESIVLPPFKDVLGNDLQFFGKVPGRAKFVESNCFQQQTSACYMTVTGLLATDSVEVFGSSAVPTLSAGRMDFVVGSKYYGISILRSGVLWAYYPMCEAITTTTGFTYKDCSGNSRHALLVNAIYGNESQQNEFHYLQKGFNKSGSIYIPKHLTNDTDYLGDTLTYIQDGKSFLPSGCFLRQYQQPSLIQADKTSGVWFDPNAEPYDVAYETLTLEDPINEQIFIGNKDKTKKLGPISSHKAGALTEVQKKTERVVRNVVDDALIEDPAFSHDVTVTASDLTYSLYNVSGYTMNGIIDWGDGTTQSVNTTAAQTITKTYSLAGTYTVKVTGTMEYLNPYHAATFVNPYKVVKINNWGNCNLRTFRFAYTKITSIPNGPITGLNQTTLSDTANIFLGCAFLAGSIPDNLLMYAKASTTWFGLFNGCTSLTGQIPENIFRYCPNLTSVASAFQGCTGLTGQIPEELLKYNTKLTTVASLFDGCIGLSGSIPTNLFRYNTEITTCQYTFRNCNKLTGSIPEDLFKYNIKITSLYGTFQSNLGLTGAIPANLFRYNTLLDTCNGTFYGCSGLSGSIPNTLLYYNTELTNVYGLFYNCTGLTGTIPTLFSTNTRISTYSDTFYGCTGFTNISTDLFRYSGASVTTFAGTFLGCTGITSIPAGLFNYNTNVTTFAGTFRGTRITTIPSNLFVNNTKVTSFSYTFAQNPSLTAIPSNMFDTNTLVTTFDNIFNGCTGITSIPTDLFKFNTLVTDMSGVFNNTRITAIPIDIFRYNNLVTSFASTFSIIGTTNTLSIPLDLFRYNPNVTSFAWTFASTKIGNLTNNVFQYNTKVTSFSSTFSQSLFGTTQIPAGLFDNCPLVTTFDNCFRYTNSTTSIPVDLFRYNTKVTSFAYCFDNGTTMTGGIPVELFRYNIEATDFLGVFQNCGILLNVVLPEDLFYYNAKVTRYTGALNASRNAVLPTRLFNIANLGKVTSWQNFLNVTSTTYSPTGTIQKIWSTTEGGDVTYTVQPTKTDAFNNCTALSNYAEIPASWT
jgi:hypothetical protein